MHGMGTPEATLRYLDGAYQIVRPGMFVVCAVTQARIAVDDLRYWSATRQEAYASAWAALEAQRRWGRL